MACFKYNYFYYITILIFLKFRLHLVVVVAQEDIAPDAVPESDYNEIQAQPTSNKSIEILPHTLLYINVEDYPGELCERACVAGANRVCYYKFVLEHYQAMGVACGNCARGVVADCDNDQCVLGDGIEKGVMSINRRIPGPAIQVCKNDFIVVDVVNHAHGTAAALHWHGLHMRDTPHMDGVPYVTQCPIPFANTFRYQFSATEAGTQFYHSHAGHHKINGQYGALIVREPQVDDKNGHTYDYDLPEHYVLISDWMHDYGEQLFPGLPSAGGIFPNSVLINGRGTYINPKTSARTSVPPTIYQVKPGKRYRFRFINSISHACPFQLQIEGHKLTIIASDSYNVGPRAFETLVTNSGERYDFILDAQHAEGDYWLRVRGMGVCSIKPTEAFALIRYISNDVNTEQRELPIFPNYSEPINNDVCLNHPNATCFGGENDHCITELSALEQDNDLRFAPPDHKFYLAFHNYPVTNTEIFQKGKYEHFANLAANLSIVGAINNLSLIFPDVPPLTQPRDMDDSMFCNEFEWPQHCANRRLCPCIHRLEVKRGSIVELVLVDESENVGRMHHPFHLHGHRFLVTSMGQHPLGVPMTVQTLKALERQRRLISSIYNPSPPFKDTVSIPSRGFAVIRFRADNPGYWLMHCHYEWHLAIGMGLILQVGNRLQMVKPPRSFPTCGNYVPRVRRPRF